MNKESILIFKILKFFNKKKKKIMMMVMLDMEVTNHMKRILGVLNPHNDDVNLKKLTKHELKDGKLNNF